MEGQLFFLGITSMRSMPTMLIAAACVATTFAGAQGQERVDAAAIAKKGAGAAIPACESCHTGLGEFPILAGQQERYVFTQLRDFRSGRRTNDIMGPIAKALSSAQVDALATYFSEQPRKAAPAPSVDAAMIERGKELATMGDSNREIFACDTCHGPQGRGGDFAALAGQNPGYILAQVQALRAGKRGNDELGIMQALAKKITDEDAQAAAAYYNQVNVAPLPPKPAGK